MVEQRASRALVIGVMARERRYLLHLAVEPLRTKERVLHLVGGHSCHRRSRFRG